jgi:hypothetical protein
VELLIVSTHNRWLVARNTREHQLEVDNPVSESKHRRDRGEELEDDDKEEDSTAPRRRALKLNFDGLRPNIAHERFTQVEMDNFLEHSRAWSAACNIEYQR